jgi:transcriptional regulator with XRE-family HTH domain
MLETMPRNLALKIAIVESGLSQVEVAKAAGIHPSKLSQFVNGHRVASDAERRILARVLKRKPTQLFEAA